MRKLPILLCALVSFFCGCSKHNQGNPYFLTYQSGTIAYSTVMTDSLVSCTYGTGYNYDDISMLGGRNQGLSDSAAAGQIELGTWYFSLLNLSIPYTAYAGTYSTDSSAGNLRRIAGGFFNFYTLSDPHRGRYTIGSGVLFSVTVTEYNTTWFSGTFEGKVAGFNSATQLPDTVTITNGKFKLPFTK